MLCIVGMCTVYLLKLDVNDDWAEKQKMLNHFWTHVRWHHYFRVLIILKGNIRKFLLLLVHVSIKLHFSLSLVISQTKQNKNKTTISVHEFVSDSTFDYPLILLFDVLFSNNFNFSILRYYYYISFITHKIKKTEKYINI